MKRKAKLKQFHYVIRDSNGVIINKVNFKAKNKNDALKKVYNITRKETNPFVMNTVTPTSKRAKRALF